MLQQYHNTYSATLVSLTFLLLPFSFALQVTFGSEWLGALPYLFLLASFVALLPHLLGRRQGRSIALLRSPTDQLVLAALLATSFLVVLQVTRDHASAVESGRTVLIYLLPIWAYVYVTRLADDDALKLLLLSIAVSSVIVSVFWVYETYTKGVLGNINWFELQTFNYIKYRNHFDDAGVNVSVIAPYSRAYGLQDRYTTTGALVAIGALALVARWPRMIFEGKVTVLLLATVVLYLGMATLSLISFAVLIPLIAISLVAFRQIPRTILKTALVTIVVLPLCFLLLKSNPVTASLLDYSRGIAGVQASYVANLDGDSAAISWVGIFRNSGLAYARYVSSDPWRALLGDGYINTAAGLQKGGDVAAFEFLATYGLIWAVVFIVLGARALWSAASALYRGLPDDRIAQVGFGLATIVFTGMTLIHYNTVFNKAIFALLFVALGLLEGPRRASVEQAS